MLPIGKVLKSDGTDGGILLGLSELGLEDIDLKEPVFIAFDGLEVPFFIEDIKPRGSSKAIVKFYDVDNLDYAEELAGRDFFIIVLIPYLQFLVSLLVLELSLNFQPQQCTFRGSPA